MSVMTKCKPFLQRAEELTAHEPIIAHYCRLHAIELLMRARKEGALSKEAQDLMLSEFGRAEEGKKKLDLSDGHDKMEAFAHRIFDAADDVDRAGGATMGTVKQYYMAGLFLDVCAQFYDGELPPDLAEKSKYAKYRTMEIRKCLQQGVRPAPPPAASENHEGGTMSTSSDLIAVNSSAPPLPAPATAPPMEQTQMVAPALAGGSIGIPAGRGVHTPSGTEREDAKKHLENASSALDFNDAESARKFLREALQLLEGIGG